MFDGKTILITGGTGSFGNAVLRRFLATNISEIRIFSRDEKKQEDMRIEFGKIRNRGSCIMATSATLRAFVPRRWSVLITFFSATLLH